MSSTCVNDPDRQYHKILLQKASKIVKMEMKINQVWKIYFEYDYLNENESLNDGIHMRYKPAIIFRNM